MIPTFEHKFLSKLEHIVNKLYYINFIIFHPFNKPLKHKITLVFGKNAIKECKSIKYLGILVDSTLSWKPHCDKI